jgi:outer membrane protein TolC
MSVRRLWLVALLAAPFALAPTVRGEETAGEEQLEPARQSVMESAEQPAEEPAQIPEPEPESAQEPMPEPALEPTPEPPPAPPRAETPAPLLHGTLELSLEDAIKMGLENNLDVQVERYAPMIADLDYTAAWGAYDPTFFGEAYYKDTRTPSANSLAGTDPVITYSSEGDGGLTGLFPLSSTEYTAKFNGSRKKFNSPFQTLSPEYDSGWSVGITQPLLRNLVWNQPWTQVRTTRLLSGESADGFRRAVMDEVQRIEDAYWTLIANEEALRVARKSLETAKALREQTKTQFEVGVVSKVEVTEAEAGVSQREVELIRTENQYRNQQDVLIDLVLGPNLRASSTLEIRPTDRPDDFTPYQVDVEGAVSRAFEHRPELAQANKEVERSEVQLAYTRNQRLPELDGIFSFGQAGVSGDLSRNFCSPGSASAFCTGFDPNNPKLHQGGFDNTYNDYDNSPQSVAGAKISIPFPNTTARANASRSEFLLGRARTSKHRLEQQIIIDVRQAARNLSASQEGILAARSAREAAAEQLRAEQVRLQYGESTPFDVLQREEALVARERDEIGAFRAYRTSVTALDRAQGTILRNRNIDIADVAPLR